MLLTAYNTLRKADPQTMTHRQFFPLRAVGLAVELGHKLARQGGVGALLAEQLRTVRVCGDLQIYTAGEWRSARAAMLQLRPQDAQLALTIVKKHRALISDLGLNIWWPDVQRGAKALDLVADFSTIKNFGVAGKLWVELKIFGKAEFEKRCEDARQTLLQEFGILQRRDGNFGGVILLAAQCESFGSVWGTPLLQAQLLSDPEGTWRDMLRPRLVARGQVATAKPTFAQIWRRMQQHTAKRGGHSVKLLKHFLKELKLPATNANERVRTYNRMLRKVGLSKKLTSQHVLELSGKPPIVGGKAVFRELYKLV